MDAEIRLLSSFGYCLIFLLRKAPDVFPPAVREVLRRFYFLSGCAKHSVIFHARYVKILR